MAVLMILDWKGVSADDYERVNEAMGIRTDADAPEGLLLHTAAVTDDGDVIIADVWESEQALGRFAETRLMPALRQVGVPEVPPRVMPVHNRLRGRSDDAEVLVLIEVPGATTEHYDRLVDAMPDVHTDGNHPAHHHVSAADGETLVIVDLWPSTDAFEQFVGSQVMPATVTAGVDMNAMQQRRARVHNRIRGEAATPA
jgi:quinol monooxygenase YgiN